MRIEELEREVRAERPTPEPDFARRLDEWAAAGFPRDAGLGPRSVAPRGAGILRRVRERLTSLPPRRVLAPAGSVAVVLVVIAVAISQSGDEGGVLDRGGESAPTEESAGGGGAAAGEAEIAPAQPGAQQLDAPAPQTADEGVARGSDQRIVDATAELTLGAEAEDVQDVANGVVEVTDRHDGIVVDSQVTTDEDGARAAFELEIPYRELDATLTDLSELGDVISRTEASEDITARAVRAQRELAGVLDRLRDARLELIRADTREERLIARSRIDSLEATADALEADVNRVQRQGRFATVSVEVTSNGAASDAGGWSLGDALDDAGSALEAIGGVALVSLAVLVPLGLVAAIVWLVAAHLQGRRREQALDRD